MPPMNKISYAEETREPRNCNNSRVSFLMCVASADLSLLHPHTASSPANAATLPVQGPSDSNNIIQDRRIMNNDSRQMIAVDNRRCISRSGLLNSHSFMASKETDREISPPLRVPVLQERSNSPDISLCTIQEDGLFTLDEEEEYHAETIKEIGEESMASSLEGYLSTTSLCSFWGTPPQSVTPKRCASPLDNGVVLKRTQSDTSASRIAAANLTLSDPLDRVTSEYNLRPNEVGSF